MTDDAAGSRQLLRYGARRARAAAVGWDEATQRVRRARLIGGIKATAFRAYAEVDLQVPPDVQLGSGIRVTVEPGTTNRLIIGPGSRIEDRVLIMLKGGTVDLGVRTELRRDVILNVAGTLTLRGDNAISWRSIVHCANNVEFAEMAGLAEHVTVADSSHFWTTPDEHFWHNVRTGEVYIGRNTWICPKVTLGRGAHVGDHCLIASNSVVTCSVPDGSFASGVPAVVRPLPLPWTHGEPDGTAKMAPSG